MWGSNNFAGMEIRQIAFDSPEYHTMTGLRVEALLSPIGIPASFIVPQKEKDDLFVAAFEEGKMIGCCILSAHEGTTAQLRQMAVHPSKQGTGIGATIVKFAEGLAKLFDPHIRSGIF